MRACLCLAVLASAAHAARVLFAPSDAARAQSLASCAAYHGRFGETSVWLAEGTDRLTADAVDTPSGRIGEDWLLFHAQPAAVEPRPVDWLASLRSNLSTPIAASTQNGQVVLAAAPGEATLLHVGANGDGVFFAMQRDDVHDTLLRLDRDPLTVLRLVSPWPLPLPLADGTSVPTADRQRIARYLDDLSFDPKISRIVDAAFADEMALHADATYLSGESSVSKLVSRHSFTEGVREAARWVISQVEGEGGAGAPKCELFVRRRCGVSS